MKLPNPLGALKVSWLMEKTLIIYKPDCIANKHVAAVLARFEQAGFQIVGTKMMRLTPALVREHYAHILTQPYYPPLEEFMLSAPVIVMALQGENVIARVRELLGPTDSRKALKGTIRGDFGLDSRVNVVHASDSDDSAKIELARFFKSEELFA